MRRMRSRCCARATGHAITAPTDERDEFAAPDHGDARVCNLDKMTAGRGAALRPARGTALMAAASLLIPMGDGIAKALITNHSPFFIAWARYAAASLIVVAVTLVWHRTSLSLPTSFGSNALRTALIVGAMTAFYFAIADIPLATAFGGYFLGPVIAAILSARMLSERITVSRLAAAISGLAGAYLIIRPGADLQLGSLLALLTGALFAGYLVATRVTVSTTSPMEALRFQCIFGALLLTPAAAFSWSRLSVEEWLLIALMGTISAACHFMVIAAFRHAEAIVLSPLVYLELVTAVVLGYVFFSELPDALAWMGIVLIVIAGLIISLADGSRC
jgi:drug/metabolite transporter (DMT)-like permease